MYMESNTCKPLCCTFQLVLYKKKIVIYYMRVRNKSLLSILLIIRYRFHKKAISVHIRFYKISDDFIQWYSKLDCYVITDPD